MRRNDVIEVFYKAGTLKVKVSARALSGGVVGDEIKLMNTTSRSTFYGLIVESGVVVLHNFEVGE